MVVPIETSSTKRKSEFSVFTDSTIMSKENSRSYLGSYLFKHFDLIKNENFETTMSSRKIVSL